MLHDSRPKSEAAAAAVDCLVGGGEMGRLMRSHDWSKTPLGPPEHWPQSLRTAVSICLNSQFPIILWWGPQLTVLYNDSYTPFLGIKHPHAALGKPGRECWHEIWHIVGPMLEGVLETGKATWSDDLLLFLERFGYPEECYFTFSYSPIRDESGGVGGVFTPVKETTGNVIGARRMRTLRDLAQRSSKAQDVAEACRAAADTIAENPYDIPFACLYLFDEKRERAELCGTARIEPGQSASPQVIDLSQERWPETSAIPAAALLGRFTLFPASELGSQPLPAGPWNTRPESVVVVPIVLPGTLFHAGFMVAGVNVRKRLDAEYRSFYEQVAAQVANAIAEARAFDEERKRAEALAELDRAKTAFFSNVSHEFRTPLTLMLGPLEESLAQRRGALSQEDRDNLLIAHRNGLRLLKLVNSLLDFSRVEAGRLQAVYEKTDLAAFTADVASGFRSAIERAGLRLIVDCPPLAEAVYLDREMWEKIVLNLLSNAFKFTFEGTIAIRLRQDATMAELSVADTGTGIPENELPHVFERFHRVPGARGRTYEGAGIGLALVQELVKLHGGSVRVESALGTGSVFTVSVPLGADHLPAERINAPRAASSTALRADAYVQEALRWLKAPVEATLRPVESGSKAPAVQKERILLADDNADMRDYVRRILSDRYEVETVGHGEAALDAVRKQRPDLLLADIMMPRLDGLQLLQRLRADPETRTLPVILLSARAGEEARVGGLQAGADDYLIKPFSARELLARVESYLNLARARRSVSDELRETDERLRRMAAIIEFSDDAIISKDLNGVISTWNAGAERLFGYSAEEAIGRKITIVFPPNRLNEEPGILERIRRGERIDHYETVRRRKDGSLVDISLTVSPIFDASGRIVGASKIARDITVRKRAEAVMAAQKDAFEILAMGRSMTETLKSFARAVEAQSPGRVLVAIHLLDESGMQFMQTIAPSLPPSYRQATDGMEVSSAAGPCCAAISERRRVVVADVAASREFAAFASFALPLGILAGSSNPIMSSTGRVLGTVATYYRQIQEARPQDDLLSEIVTRTAAVIIERSRAEALLRESEQRFRNMADHAPAMIWVTATDANRTYLNQTWYEFTAQEPQSALGQAWLQAVHPEDREQAQKILLSANPERKALSVEYRLRRADGQYRWVIDTGSPRFGDQGEFLGYIGLVMDITERKQAEEWTRESAERLRLANAALRRSNDDLQRFGYVSSHDLQEPLRTIRAFTELLSQRHGEHFGPEDEYLLTSVMEGAARMEALLQGLLQYSRVTAAADRRIQCIDCQLVLTAVLKNLEGQLRETGARVEAGSLPVVLGDYEQLVQLFQNLLANALKYRRPDVPCVVRISADRQNGARRFAVADNGIGFKPEYAGKIFEIFRQLDRSYPGTGIGLAICKTIVERHGGRIWAESVEGQGATFYFTLPNAEESEESNASHDASQITADSRH